MWRCASRRLVPAVYNSRAAVPIAGSGGPQQYVKPAVAVSSLRLSRWFSAQPPTAPKEGTKMVTEDDLDLAIATGLELEEMLAERQGKKLFDLDPPRGPFGTKERPAIIQSRYDERIVGCSGGVGEDEHDVLWFRLKKGELHECRVCSQVFKLEVVGPGGSPGGHHH